MSKEQVIEHPLLDPNGVMYYVDVKLANGDTLYVKAPTLTSALRMWKDRDEKDSEVVNVGRVG